VEAGFDAEDADELEAAAGVALFVDEPLATGVVAEPAGAAAETLGDVELAVPFKQPVSPPVWTVNMADCEDAPAESRRVRSSWVPAG